MDARLLHFATKDGKRSITIRYMAGQPRAWITDHAPDFQEQHEFAEGIEVTLCEQIFSNNTTFRPGI